MGRRSISGAVGRGRHHRGSPLCTTVARCSCKTLFLQRPLEKIATFGGRIRSLRSSEQVPTMQYSREDPRSAAAPCRRMPQHTAISFPPASGLRAAGQDWVTLGDSQLLVASLRYTLLPPGGTKKKLSEEELINTSCSPWLGNFSAVFRIAVVHCVVVKHRVMFYSWRVNVCGLQPRSRGRV